MLVTDLASENISRNENNDYENIACEFYISL